jgi:hypothetical protein
MATTYEQSAAAPTWREERRRDRAAEAQLAREDAAARAQARIAADEAAARLRREEHQARMAERKAARKQRSARWTLRMAWLKAHLVDLLFVPVIVVPSVLAWTAMAAYGVQVFGPAGASLPAFSEGAMWAFAGATTLTRRHHPERPLWPFRAGTAVFAAYGAALNFSHGVTPEHGALRGIAVGVVMALVSVAGVTAHQLITAGPRRSRAERAAARTDRVIARRERAIRHAALKNATAFLAADGDAHLMIKPGIVHLTRRHGRVQLRTAPSSPVWLPDPMVLPGTPEPGTARLNASADEAVATYRGWRAAHVAAPAVQTQELREPAHQSTQPQRIWPRPVAALRRPVSPQDDPRLRRPASTGTVPVKPPQTSLKSRAGAASNSASNGASKPAAKKPQNSALKPSEKRAIAERLLRENPLLTTSELVEQSGVSKATAERIRAQAPTPLRMAR